MSVIRSFLGWFFELTCLFFTDLEQNNPGWTVRTGADPATASYRSQPGQWGEYNRRDQLHSGASAGGLHGGRVWTSGEYSCLAMRKRLDGLSADYCLQYEWSCVQRR